MQIGTYWKYLIIRLTSGIETIYIKVPIYIFIKIESVMRFLVFTRFS